MLAPSPKQEPDEPLTSLIFPAYNPGPLLERTLREVERFLAQAPGAWEVLFVCDGCTDGSPERLAAWAATAPGRARVLAHSPNRGKGYAVRAGLAAARGAWRLFTDVDLAYSFEDVLRAARALHAGADVVIASRLHPDSRVIVPPRLQGYAYRRHLQGQLFSWLARWLLPLRQRDTQAGLKGLSGRAARRLLPQLRCDGFAFDCELLTACARLGLAVVEVPVCVGCEDQESTTSLRGVARMVGDLWKIRQDWRRRPPGTTLVPEEAARRRVA
jgi:hypothetical protein